MAKAREALDQGGAVRLYGLITGQFSEWESATLPFFKLGKPGHRISGCPEVARLASQIVHASEFAEAAGDGWRCVRAIAFNKSPIANWNLGWHQDRTIAVARREEVPEYAIWSSKDDLTHVEPPFAVLERMVTLRVHLDRVDADNAPLLIAKGSHQRGKTAGAEIDGVIKGSQIETCIADAGDGWLYSTPILHASARSTSAGNRRVLHLDFSRDTLPAPLQWAGIG